jgi:hypothetical protein
VNDHPLTFPATPNTWVDVAFETAVIPRAALRQGNNTVVLQTAYTDMTDLEAVYLLGDMGVAVQDAHVALTTLPTVLGPQCITGQGLPFYSGGVRYHVPLQEHIGGDERLFLEIPGHEGAVINLYDGTVLLHTLPWPPYEADITDLVRRGASHVTLEVVLTRRNTFGPLHEVHGTGFCHPGSFITSGENYTDGCMLYPAGLLQPPVLSVRAAATVTCPG